MSPERITYTHGEELELTAVPNEGRRFDHWQGDLTGSDNPVVLNVEEDINITALFTVDDYMGLQLGATWVYDFCNDFYENLMGYVFSKQEEGTLTIQVIGLEEQADRTVFTIEVTPILTADERETFVYEVWRTKSGDYCYLIDQVVEHQLAMTRPLNRERNSAYRSR